MILCFIRFKDKELVMQIAWEKGTLPYKNTTVHLFNDLSLETGRKIKLYDGVKQVLKNKRITYELLYPVRLHITHNGQKLLFHTLEDDSKFAGDLDEAE